MQGDWNHRGLYRWLNCDEWGLSCEKDSVMQEDRVWYVGYGSNLYLHRFLLYLKGGRATRVARPHSPCQAGRAPEDIRSFPLPFRLFFACESPNWYGGGVAFIDTERGNQFLTYGRAYLLELPQLRHVALEENGGKGVIDIEAGNLSERPVGYYHDVRDNGWYKRMVCCGLGPDGRYPAVTLTGVRDELLRLPRRPPHRSYLDRIRKGLREMRGERPELTNLAIRAYLREARSAFPRGKAP